MTIRSSRATTSFYQSQNKDPFLPVLARAIWVKRFACRIFLRTTFSDLGGKTSRHGNRRKALLTQQRPANRGAAISNRFAGCSGSNSNGSSCALYLTVPSKSEAEQCVVYSACARDESVNPYLPRARTGRTATWGYQNRFTYPGVYTI